jgi:hypothetical protein
MRNNNQLDNMVCHLTAHELIVAFYPIARMRNAGYRTISEFLIATVGLHCR